MLFQQLRVLFPLLRKKKKKKILHFNRFPSIHRLTILHKLTYSKGRISTSGFLPSRFTVAIYQARVVVEMVNRGGTSVEKKDTQRSGYLASSLNSLLYFPPLRAGLLSHAMAFLNRSPLSIPSLVLKVNAIRHAIAQVRAA